MSSNNRAARGFTEGLQDDVDWFGDLTRRRSTGPVSPHHRTLSAEMSQETLAVQAGTYEDPVTGAVGTPIFATTTFDLGSDSYSAFSDGALRDVPIYTRYGNPSQWSVQEKIASLEGAESGLITSSGMAAVASTVFALTNEGGHIISAYDVYGGTYNFLREDISGSGRDVTFIDPLDLDAIQAAIRPETQMILLETLTNPLLKIPDIEAIGELAKRSNILLVVDNTFLTPINCRPLRVGADIVVHSATKYLSGHSDVTAGVVVGSRKYLDRIWAQALRFGGSAEAMTCYLVERGMKTLALRVAQQNRSAGEISKYLNTHPAVLEVAYPTLHPETIPPFLREAPGFGGVVSFRASGGDRAALAVMKRLEIPRTATSLGGVESLVSMPTNTSHSSLTSGQKQLVGIQPGLVRLSIGIEGTTDILRDLEKALASEKEETDA
ncbi:trans-sulfuration enzyme family protein [Rathayibacter iranicus]|nr:aminotransferase class I/II-fold pyridoxal phosphate-dependent enzyme [Rathayibacter iranicus]PWJ64019.1 cystathionine gamma-synthase [Rathayibacter iranicus NCPPB 2253 = VKM Ac-1602]